MTSEGPRHGANDPERDRRLAHFLKREYGTSQARLAARAEAVVAAVARRAGDTRAWWAPIAAWARALVPIEMAVAAAVLFIVLRVPSAGVTPNVVADPEPANRVAVVDILATRATGQDLVAVLWPATADDLLTAAVRR